MVITGVNVILPIVMQDVKTLHAATVRMCNILYCITIVCGLYCILVGVMCTHGNYRG